jgi:aerobic-type carbon monoxide dehydrogenase small subunit (CoxS/CutS family)
MPINMTLNNLSVSPDVETKSILLKNMEAKRFLTSKFHIDCAYGKCWKCGCGMFEKNPNNPWWCNCGDHYNDHG